MGTGTLTFQKRGKQCVAYVSNVSSVAAIEQMAHALKSAGLTHAGIPRVTYCVSGLPEIEESAAEADVGMFANVLMRRVSDGKLYGLLIHAPNMSMFEAVENEGYRVTQGDGVAVAEIYSDCAGEEYTFHDGWLQGSSTQGTLAP